VGAYLAAPSELGVDVLQHADDAMYSIKGMNAHPDRSTKGS
jgi:hypothetical protein